LAFAGIVDPDTAITLDFNSVKQIVSWEKHGGGIGFTERSALYGKKGVEVRIKRFEVSRLERRFDLKRKLLYN
jgi:hypothetical protein